MMIDIHAHILPGLDDGARTAEESLEMCKLYAAQGVASVVATPHLCDPRFPVSPEAVRTSVEELARACREHAVNLEILAGGDVRLEPELLEALDAAQVLTLGDAGSHLLLELPAQTVPHVEALVFELLLRGVTPVLSHPERNLELWRRPNRLAELVELGCLAQITAGSLLGRFGPWPRRTAERFLAAGLVHAVATDAHSARGPRSPALGEAAGRLRALVGETAAYELLCQNPASMIRRTCAEPKAESPSALADAGAPTGPKSPSEAAR
jgi:protein-tyrosine phosphatase